MQYFELEKSVTDWQTNRKIARTDRKTKQTINRQTERAIEQTDRTIHRMISRQNRPLHG